MKIAFLFFFIFLFLNINAQDCQSVPVKECTLSVIAIADQGITVSATLPISPGSVLKFDSTYYIIHRQLDTLLYWAKFDKTIGKSVQKPSIGTKTMATALLSHKDSGSTCFWLTLRNIFNTARPNADSWLVLENAPDPNRFDVESPFMLSVRTPPIQGYLCLMEVRNEYEVIVYFPNNREGTDVRKLITFKGRTNLTYLDEHGSPAFANIFLAPESHGKTTFIALISKYPRPLSDFLPPNHQVRYFSWDGMRIQPWQIGPGFYQGGVLEKQFKGADYLPGDEWVISKLDIVVK